MTSIDEINNETDNLDDGMPYPMPPLDKFLNPFNEPEKAGRCSSTCMAIDPFYELPEDQPKWWSIDYWLNKLTLFLISQELQKDWEEKRRTRIRSLANYFSNFNNLDIPSIWQTNSFGDRIRTSHHMVKDRILSKAENSKIVAGCNKIRDIWTTEMIKNSVRNTIDPSDIDPNFTKEHADSLWKKIMESKQSQRILQEIPDHIEIDTNDLYHQNRKSHEGLPQ